MIKLDEKVALLGADPELAIRDKSTNILKSATEILKGDKDHPEKVKMGAVLADNVNLEFNTKPAKSAKEYVNTFKVVLNESLKLVGKDNKLVIQASADYPKEALVAEATQKFGCSSDFDGWQLKINEIDSEAASRPFRSCGGHIHVGYTAKSKKLLIDQMGKIRVIRIMDLILGIPSIFLDKDPSSPLRRKLYGKAGCHRPKPYGVEYRTLGPFWVASPQLVSLMHKLTCLSVQICLENKDVEFIDMVGKDKIQDIINESKVKEAKDVFEKFLTKIIPANIVKEIIKLESKEFDFYKEWNLKK